MDAGAGQRSTIGIRRLVVRRVRPAGPGPAGRTAPAVVLLAAGCLALGLSACTATGPAPGPTEVATASSSPTTAASVAPTAALVDAVFSRLPVAARSAPAFTWDSAGGAGQGEAGAAGTDLLLAAACDGGGELTVTVGGEDTVLDCSSSAAVGPVDVTATISADAPTGVEVAVRPTAGRPRYVAKAVSLAPSESTAAASAS